MSRKMRVTKLFDIALDAVDMLYQMDFDREVWASLVSIRAELIVLKRKVVG